MKEKAEQKQKNCTANINAMWLALKLTTWCMQTFNLLVPFMQLSDMQVTYTYYFKKCGGLNLKAVSICKMQTRICVNLQTACSYLMPSGICRNWAPILGPVITGAPEVNYSYLCLVPPIWTTQLEAREWAPPLSHRSTHSRWELCSVLSARCCRTLKETGMQILSQPETHHRRREKELWCTRVIWDVHLRFKQLELSNTEA